MYMDTTAPNTNVNTHTFFLFFLHTFTCEQTYRLNLQSVETLGLKVVSTCVHVRARGSCGMYVGQFVVENTKLRSVLLQISVV